MKKIIYIFIFLLPILLLSCSGSSNEAELKKQLEIAEQKNQELIQKSEVEAKAKSEAEAKAKSEVEAKAKSEVEAKAKAEAKNPNAIVLGSNTTAPKAPDQKGADNKPKAKAEAKSKPKPTIPGEVLTVGDLEKEFELNAVAFQAKYPIDSSMRISGEIDSIKYIHDWNDWDVKPGIDFKSIQFFVLSIDALFSSMDTIVNLTAGQNIILDCSISYYDSYSMQLKDCSIPN